MVDEIHPVLLNLPVSLHNVLVRYKEFSGVNITNQIYEAITSWLFMKKLIDLDSIGYLNGNGKKIKKEEPELEPVPEELKFCDGDKCEFDPTKMGSC